MLEDVKGWIRKLAFERQRSSLRKDLVRHQGASHFDLAVEAARTLYAGEKEFLGPTAASTVQTLAAFAALLVDAGRPADAEPYWVELLDIKRQTLGEEDPSVGQVLRMLGRLKVKRNCAAEAVDFYEKALALQLKVHGEDHRETDTTRRELEELKRDQALKKPVPSTSPQVNAANAMLPAGTVIFAVWIRNPTDRSSTPLLLGDFEDAFGDGKGITIGSGEDCKVVLEGPEVAPLHLHIEDKGGSRKMHVHDKVVIPVQCWEHPIAGVEAIFEAGTLVLDPTSFLVLKVGPIELAYRELRGRDAQELIRHVQFPGAGGSAPEAPAPLSSAQGPFRPKDREVSTGGRFLVGVFVTPGLDARTLGALGTALKQFRESQAYVVRIEGLQELFSGRYPVFGDVPSWVAIDGAVEPLLVEEDTCLLVECQPTVTADVAIADLQAVIPAGASSGVRHLLSGALRVAPFKKHRGAGTPQTPVMGTKA